MYTIEITVTNPVTNHRKTKVMQFDPAVMDEAAWTAGWPLISLDIQALLSLAADSEPVLWEATNPKFTEEVTKATVNPADVVAAPAIP